MIVKNEERTLASCLNSIKTVADEIIVVDTGSNDRTKKIALEFTDKVFDFEWVDDFSSARNFSFAQASMDYILWLDADDVILPDDVIKFQHLKNNLPADVQTVMMRYNTGFDENGNVIFSFFRERLVKRAAGFKWNEPVHEYIKTAGKTVSSDICITHTKKENKPSVRNLSIYEKQLAKGTELSARGKYYYARELKDNGRYADAANFFRMFLDSKEGWSEDNIAACGELARCCLFLNSPDEALLAMLRSFDYDVPRPEICCQLGYFFKERGSYKQAAFWFNLALKAEKNDNLWGFRQEDCRGYIPAIELVLCHSYLGNDKKAAEFNELAAEFKPDSAAVLHNRNYFKNKL